jgi:hypothetical protein
MTPPQPHLCDEGFPLWRDRVDRLLRDQLSTTLEGLPELPLQAGFEAGDTPAEFIAGCVIPTLDEADTLGP